MAFFVERQATFGQESQVWHVVVVVVASARETELFTLWPIPEGRCVAMSDGNLGSAGLISSWILVGLIREQTFVMGISVSGPDSPISIHPLFPQFMIPKRVVFNLPVCSLLGGRSNG